LEATANQASKHQAGRQAKAKQQRTSSKNRRTTAIEIGVRDIMKATGNQQVTNSEPTENQQRTNREPT
jgi:hypothetical protein